jgi:NTP pyrophosphatase (non-canonical NTP hydrolase)
MAKLFEVGQKVVCFHAGSGGSPSLEVGKTYIVSRVENDSDPQFIEVDGKSISWLADRFRAIPETAPATEEKVYETALRCLAPLVINQMCEKTHKSNVKAGWWDQAENPLVVPTKIALIVSECVEALEGHRRGLKDDKLTQYDMIAVELADVLIRVFDLAGFLKIPLGTIIADKEAYNALRADHKPENRAAKGGKRY